MRKAVGLSAAVAATLVAIAPVAAHGAGNAAAASGTFSSTRIGRTHFGGAGSGFSRRIDCRLFSRRACFGRRFRGNGLALGYGFGWYGGGLVEDPEALRDQGFFADTGDAWNVGGRAVYDYDRSYPYDWYRDPEAAAARAEPRIASAAPEMRCDVAWVAGARGRREPVRVCRGH